MHPADRLAITAVFLFAAGVVTLAPVVWHAFEGRWINVALAVVAAVCFMLLGWIACRWEGLAYEGVVQ